MSNGKAKADDDFDDLDDVLDQFTGRQVTPPTSKPPADDALSDDFAHKLAAEMESMMRAMGGDGSATDSAFRETWNKMLIEDLEGGGRGNDLNYRSEGNQGGGVSTSGPKEATTAAGDARESSSGEDDAFQKAIRQAMEKLQDSDETIKADSKAGQDGLEGLLASLGDLKLGEDDAEGGENIESMLETMMSQLMSKDILYEPLKELDTKYPNYLVQHASSLSSEDLSRYTNQKARVSQIVAIFENSSYSDDNAAQSTEILRLMNEMQSFGSPPSEIMGPMPPGFDLGADGLPKLPEGCVVL